ncbi:MAG: hypothetical protein Q9199_002793 [Rusavskia elegans]
MDRWQPQRVYSGAVRGEVVIQGDLSAQGDINIVIGSARTAYRDLVESPRTFGSMQKNVQEAIKTLLAVSEMTSQYLKEGRFDGEVEQELVKLSHECRNHLAELQSMGQEFETMDTQAFRQDDLRRLTESLDAKVQGLEDINGRVNSSMLQLEKALKKYIAQVKDGERASTIMSSVSSSSTASTMGQKEWRLIQKELESVGITAAQFTANREKVLKTLSDAFQGDVAEDSSIEIKKAGQLARFLSTLLSRGKDLLAAVEEGNVTKAKDLLRKGADVDTQDFRGFTPLLVAVREQNFELANLLLSYEADVNKRDSSTLTSTPLTPLAWAVDRRSVAIINLLLDHGADVSAESAQYPPTALGMAIDQGSFDIVETLVKHRCDVNQAFEDGTPLSLAIRKGGIDIIRYLIQHDAHIHADALLAAVETWNIEHLRFLLIHHKKAGGPKTGLSASALAASRVGNEDALSLLVENGANVNSRTKVEKIRVRRNDLNNGLRTVQAGGETLVWLAAAAGHHRSLGLLLAKGADIKIRAHPRACTKHTREGCLFAEQNVYECTAVQIAVSHGHWDCARLLVRHGGDLNGFVSHIRGEKAEIGFQTLLRLVIKTPVNPTERLEILADLGADPNREDPDGKTPLHVVSTVSYDRADKVTMAQSLVAKGARVNCQDEMGATPLHYAVSMVSPDCELIEFLLKNGADLNSEERSGKTPLHLVSTVAHNSADRITMARTLVAKGARINCQDKLGLTPLHYTVNMNSPHYALIEFLLQNGADPNAKDISRQTPLHFARRRRDQKTVEALLRAGGKVVTLDN